MAMTTQQPWSAARAFQRIGQMMPKNLTREGFSAWLTGCIAGTQVVLDTTEIALATPAGTTRIRSRSSTRQRNVKSNVKSGSTAPTPARRTVARTATDNTAQTAADANRIYNALPATGMVDRANLKLGRGPKLPIARIDNAIDTLVRENRIVVNGSFLGQAQPQQQVA
jgi:hypothetical protein